jgi:hypothetical protein
MQKAKFFVDGIRERPASLPDAFLIHHFLSRKNWLPGEIVTVTLLDTTPPTGVQLGTDKEAVDSSVKPVA